MKKLFILLLIGVALLCGCSKELIPEPVYMGEEYGTYSAVCNRN